MGKINQVLTLESLIALIDDIYCHIKAVPICFDCFLALDICTNVNSEFLHLGLQSAS